MGLRFRRSLSIIPGVKLNFGKTGVSVSAGVPGFRKTFHSSGRTTTSIGIPGTGISYVTTENRNRENTPKTEHRQPQSYTQKEVYTANYETTEKRNPPSSQSREVTKAITTDIHKVSDEEIDWTEIYTSNTPPDDTYNHKLWDYYHSVSREILSGNIDTYLKVINDINPLSDLLDYGTEFEFGTDSPLKMEVEFKINSKNITISKTSADYQDYVCSVAIRIARDMFALLPVQNVVVHAMDGAKDVLSVCFDKKSFSDIKFSFIDPSNTITTFNHKMNFDKNYGFMEIRRLDI